MEPDAGYHALLIERLPREQWKDAIAKVPEKHRDWVKTYLRSIWVRIDNHAKWKHLRGKP